METHKQRRLLPANPWYGTSLFASVDGMAALRGQTRVFKGTEQELCFQQYPLHLEMSVNKVSKRVRTE